MRSRYFAASIFVLTLWASPAWASSVLLGSTAEYALLALNNGYLSINSATSISGNVGASSGVYIASAQKVDTLNGSMYLSSGMTTLDFLNTYADATVNPTGGIHSGSTSGCPAGDPLLSCDGASVNARLNQANADAAALQAQLAALSYTSLGAVTTSRSFTSNAEGTNYFDATNWSYNSNVLTLNGDANSWFVFRVGGNGNSWAQSQTVLNGVSPDHVLFYFTADAAAGVDVFDVSKATSVFAGTIFAPLGGVEYHNPGTFTGRIVAESITVHSDFNIAAPSPGLSADVVSTPEPGGMLLLGSGLAVLLRLRFRSTPRQ